MSVFMMFMWLHQGPKVWLLLSISLGCTAIALDLVRRSGRKVTLISYIVGFVMVALCIEFIAIHLWATFVADNPPYNLVKGSVQIGLLGLFLWWVGLGLINSSCQSG
jgi:hypothetical protein